MQFFAHITLFNSKYGGFRDLIRYKDYIKKNGFMNFLLYNSEYKIHILRRRHASSVN